MPVLVTGASGTFGAHTAKRLLELGQEVISVEHDTHPYDTASLLGLRDKITWIRGDLTDERLCRRIVADYAVTSIFHFAALPIVQVATRTTTPIFEANILGTVNLLEAVKENHWAGKSIRFIYISTDKVYGDAGEQPYQEHMPLNGLAIYDVSKACADMIARTYAAAGFTPDVVVARPCNIIAPGDLNLGRIVPRTIIPCLRGDSPILYRTSYRREFIDVEDAVEALIMLDRALLRDPANIRGKAFNIGSRQQRTLEAVLDTILEHFPGITPTWTPAPEISRIEIPFQKLDSSRVMAHTGWTPKFTFEQTIERCVNWWRAAWPTLPEPIRQKRVQGWHG